ncbi:cyclin-dependent kinase 4 inhibitor D [Periophthalmus magnuspinnatus]|uniref:cyclin-dependent kinase 4 inhibitor D n=1 Tax=Periophthalmus magnuspinnatus TaxID=409849 RepID=UPI00243711B5|nr:cyclin-dependent kinase 4 inhibitor D [Periophthalmus magnuspinnatus]
MRLTGDTAQRANVCYNVYVYKLFCSGLGLKNTGLLSQRVTEPRDTASTDTKRQRRMVLRQMDAGKCLTAAAATGNTREVQRMMEEGRVHPDTTNEYGRTALQVMMMGNPKVASLLLQKGANPNVQDKYGISPAHDAARTGFVDTLQVLVEHGASVNVADKNGALPIHIAIREGHRDVVAFLAPRSDLKHVNTSGQTAVDVARASRVPDMVDLLFAHVHS